jgi:hypothetical protein
MKKMLSTLIPGAAAKRATPSSRRGTAGGLAVLAAAAGVAFSQRDKLRRSGRGTNPTPPPGAPAA